MSDFAGSEPTGATQAPATRAAVAGAPASSPRRSDANNRAAEADWRSGLPEELRAHPALAQATDIAALAKEHVNLQTLIGRKGVIPPTDKDGPEVWDRFYGALGRPSSPDGYDFKAPDDMPEGAYSETLARAFADVAHKTGLSAKQAAALHDWFAGAAAEDARARSADSARKSDALETELRIEWGPDFGAKVNAARRAARAFADADQLDKLEQALGGVGLLQMFARIGEAMGEDRIVGGGSAPIAGPEQAKAEIARIRGEALKDPKHALNDRFHPEHGLMVAKLEKLYAIAYPDAAA